MFPVIDDWEAFKTRVRLVCDLIFKAIQGEINLASVDEKTGIQALERKIIRKNGNQRTEYEYKRNGTTCLMAAVDIETGDIVSHRLNDTRNENDFLVFIQGLTDKYQDEDEVIIMADNLNTHMSASLVKWVAKKIKFESDLGTKGYKGILKSMESRKKFLENQSHRIRFVYTPKHCSWLNPIENWFSKLQRQAISRESFESKEVLCQRIETYIQYYNKFFAKPLKWKFKGFTKDRKFYEQDTAVELQFNSSGT